MNLMSWISCVLVVVAASALTASSQVKWLADASSAEIPTAAAAGTINGSDFSSKHGTLDKTGYIRLGSSESTFEHFTIQLRDAERLRLAKFSVTVSVTVRKGELPDGKTFRKLPVDSLHESQPSLGEKGSRVPEFHYLNMEGPSDFPAIGKILSGPEFRYSGTVTFGSRKDGKIPVGLYVCFHDEQNSCVAGRFDLAILETTDR